MATKKTVSKTAAAKAPAKEDAAKVVASVAKETVKKAKAAKTKVKAAVEAKAAPKAAEIKKTKAAVKETVATAAKKAEAKKTEVKKTAAATKKTVEKTVKKTESSVKKQAKIVAAKVTSKSTKENVASAPKEICIFKAITAGDLVSFKALIPAQKNRRGDFGRTPLMVVSLIRSNPRMTDGSNYETKRVCDGKAIYDKMYQLLLDAKCDKNAMDDAGNTARDYNYGGILNQMIAD